MEHDEALELLAKAQLIAEDPVKYTQLPLPDKRQWGKGTRGGYGVRLNKDHIFESGGDGVASWGWEDYAQDYLALGEGKTYAEKTGPRSLMARRNMLAVGFSSPFSHVGGANQARGGLNSFQIALSQTKGFGFDSGFNEVIAGVNSARGRLVAGNFAPHDEYGNIDYRAFMQGMSTPIESMADYGIDIGTGRIAKKTDDAIRSGKVSAGKLEDKGKAKVVSTVRGHKGITAKAFEFVDENNDKWKITINLKGSMEENVWRALQELLNREIPKDKNLADVIVKFFGAHGAASLLENTEIKQVK